ncbi:hypothetical protein [Methylocella sp.]|jgi:hypothetical protein|uniref:hypothetical protein n=1 Tax=Methylocella sp. TaxID=1978226 RepID=UPI003C726609
MEKHRNIQRKTGPTAAMMGDLDPPRGFEASPAETAQYLAEMASELVTLARTAGLERLSLLLDFVAREAEAEAETSAA